MENNRRGQAGDRPQSAELAEFFFVQLVNAKSETEKSKTFRIAVFIAQKLSGRRKVRKSNFRNKEVRKSQFRDKRMVQSLKQGLLI